MDRKYQVKSVLWNSLKNYSALISTFFNIIMSMIVNFPSSFISAFFNAASSVSVLPMIILTDITRSLEFTVPLQSVSPLTTSGVSGSVTVPGSPSY